MEVHREFPSVLPLHWGFVIYTTGKLSQGAFGTSVLSSENALAFALDNLAVTAFPIHTAGFSSLP